MKTTLSLVIIAFAIASAAAQQTVTQTAQAEAVRLYPDLGKSGSPLNQRFLKALDDARRARDPILSQAGWPLTLAKRVAEESGQKAIQKPVANPGRGLAKLVKLTVDQVSASPFSFEGALIELTGIRSIDVQEIEGGVYELKIWGSDAKPLIATLPRERAAAAERSRTLLVSVDKPARHRSTVIIHGNKTVYQGLSTMPTPVWTAEPR